MFVSGSVAIHDLPLGEPADFTIVLDRELPDTTYDVSLLRSPALMTANVTTEIVTRTTKSVTVRVVAGSAFAGQAVLHALCYRDPTAKPKPK